MLFDISKQFISLKSSINFSSQSKKLVVSLLKYTIVLYARVCMTNIGALLRIREPGILVKENRKRKAFI